jgi:hypothetical protein
LLRVFSNGFRTARDQDALQVLGARERPHVRLVHDQRRVDQGEQDPHEQLGVVGAVGGAGRVGPDAVPQPTGDAASIARTRAVTRSASRFEPKPRVLITEAVRASRS